MTSIKREFIVIKKRGNERNASELNKERSQPTNNSIHYETIKNQQPPGLAAGSLKLVMVKPPRDDSDDPPRLKTGCEKFQLFQDKSDRTPPGDAIAPCQQPIVQRTPVLYSRVLFLIKLRQMRVKALCCCTTVYPLKV